MKNGDRGERNSRPCDQYAQEGGRGTESYHARERAESGQGGELTLSVRRPGGSDHCVPQDLLVERAYYNAS